METFEVSIKYEGKDAIVRLKRMTWGEANECVRKATRMVNGTPQLDAVLLQELRLLQSLVEAPFLKTLEGLRALDEIEGNKVFNKMQELNRLSGDVEKN